MSHEQGSLAMAPQPGAVDLVHMADAETSLVVRVTGSYGTGSHGSLILEAEVLVSAGFVDARLTTYIHQSDLDEWHEGLTAATIGKALGINNNGGRGLSISMFVHEDGFVSMQVMSPDQLWVHFGCQPSDGWIDDHRRRLEAVRRAWAA